MMRVELFRIVQIETQSSCTRHCWFCKFGQPAEVPLVQMDWSTIRRIVEDLAASAFTGRISWFLINEPLQDPRMCEILRHTRAACPKAFLSLVTNGDLLSPDLYSRLMAAGLDALGVSAYSADTLQELEFLRSDRRARVMDMRFPLELRLENRGGNVHLNSHIFDSDRMTFAKQGCARPFTTMSIDARGNVVLCCADFYAQVVMGNVNQHNLQTIWFNEAFTKYRNMFESVGRESLDLCSGCSHDGSSSAVQYPLVPLVQRVVRSAIGPVQSLVRKQRKWSRLRAGLRLEEG